MYLTCEQAMQLIKPSGAKNPNYSATRIRQLINLGHLVEAKPEIFVDDNSIFVSLGFIKTECLVTEESVINYIQNRKDLKNTLGKIPKKNREVKAYFEDNSCSSFISIESACLFFGISRDKIMRSIEKKKYIKVQNEMIKFV